MQKGHHQEVLRLERESTDRNSRLSEAVSAMKAHIVVIAPEMEELKRQYVSLKNYCIQLPTILRSTVEHKTKQVGTSHCVCNILFVTF